ncbi:HNH endonuclease [Azoarcus sp. KH32C]|uniref:HNH endonuclease n=1 Tax=Azoarcus sp. KH32C TaxID=748247 RepID=UPI0002386819|nr:HNH endonuclease [Azoarcus sp. KH32C]BAL23732.1 putative nuclease [Azoarcus sp. KH32C]
MSTPHLDRLLFVQGGLCFFCKQPLPRAEASIEHLVASANGGTNGEDNCVACCRTLNSLLGSKSIKEKIQIVLNQHGDFRCPKNREQVPAPALSPLAPSAEETPEAPDGDSGSLLKAPAPPLPVEGARSVPTASPTVSKTQQDRIALVLADLRKRGNSRPRKEATLTSTIQALIKQRTNQPISDANLKKLLQEMRRRGLLTILDGNVTYNL